MVAMVAMAGAKVTVESPEAKAKMVRAADFSDSEFQHFHHGPEKNGLKDVNLKGILCFVNPGA